MPRDDPKQLDLPSEGLQKAQFSNLGNVVQTSLLDDSPDEFTKESLEDFELQRKRQDFNHRQDEHDQRINFAKKIYWLSCGWLSVVIVVLVASGIKCLPFELDNSVLITLLTTTTATVLGLFISVLNYLFSKKK